MKTTRKSPILMALVVIGMLCEFSHLRSEFASYVKQLPLAGVEKGDVSESDTIEGGISALKNDSSLQEMIRTELEQILAQGKDYHHISTTSLKNDNLWDVQSIPSLISTAYPPLLPTCKSLMQAKHSPFQDGSFLTRHSIPVYWVPRADGSRELRHSMCQLHRYTAQQARQCLAGKHLNLIGDSLMRYQYMSLTWFLLKGHYPPHYGIWRGKGTCPRIDEHGQEQCSPPHEPNVCMEIDWSHNTPPGRTARMHFKQEMGGPMFDGHMESSSVKANKLNPEMLVENNLYVSPHFQLYTGSFQNSTVNKDKDKDNNMSNKQNRLMVSYAKENGFDHPNPINGWNLTGCAFTGTCTYPNTLAKRNVDLAYNMKFDFSQPLAEALEAPNGALHQIFPPVDIVIYNRGLWGVFHRETAHRVMPRLYNYSRGAEGQCYFRSTTGRFEHTLDLERNKIRREVLQAGCGYIDFAHLVNDFNQLEHFYPPTPRQKHGNGMDERSAIFWDAVHFMPWVYEELNNMLLNILCNANEDAKQNDVS